MSPKVFEDCTESSYAKNLIYSCTLNAFRKEDLERVGNSSFWRAKDLELGFERWTMRSHPGCEGGGSNRAT